jgi:proteasome assembly chaperone (PAC2) family protein
MLATNDLDLIAQELGLNPCSVLEILTELYNLEVENHQLDSKLRKMKAAEEEIQHYSKSAQEIQNFLK